MKILVYTVTPLILTGCLVSPVELRLYGPERRFESEKSVDNIAQCIHSAWQNQPLSGLYYDVFLQSLDEDDRTVMTTGAVEMVDVIASKDKTKVEFFYQKGMMDWRKNKRILAVIACL
jgi:hypothetical protein